MAIWKRRLKLSILYWNILFLLHVSWLIGIQAENSEQKSPRSGGLLKLTFGGEKGSFAQLSDWPLASSPSNINWTLSLDFRTNISSGILLYASSTTGVLNTYAGQSHSAFLQLRLIASQLELSIKTPDVDHVEDKQVHHHSHKKALEKNVAASLQHIVMKLGTQLNNNQWHTVLIRKVSNTIEVCIQSITVIRSEEICQSTTLSSAESIYRNNAGENIRVFLGGLPLNYSTHFSVLANPSVIFEPRFNGVVRNVEYFGTRKFGRTVVSKSEGVIVEQMAPLCEQGTCHVLMRSEINQSWTHLSEGSQKSPVDMH